MGGHYINVIMKGYMFTTIVRSILWWIAYSSFVTFLWTSDYMSCWKIVVSVWFIAFAWNLVDRKMQILCKDVSDEYDKLEKASTEDEV